MMIFLLLGAAAGNYNKRQAVMSLRLQREYAMGTGY